MQPVELAEVVGEVCDRLSIPYCITGSIASSYYGNARTTHDVDVIVALPSARVDALCRAFAGEDWYVSEEAAREAARARGMFNVLHSPSGLKVDFIVLADSAFDQGRLERARMAVLPSGKALRFASPEDVILKKLEFFREGGSDKHLTDIAGMLRVSGAEIDRAFIDRWAGVLGVSADWERMKQAVP
ncbi:MAG: hypothetical protein WD749_05260 [Phycisphaerales bacterium]